MRRFQLSNNHNKPLTTTSNPNPLSPLPQKTSSSNSINPLPSPVHQPDAQRRHGLERGPAEIKVARGAAAALVRDRDRDVLAAVRRPDPLAAERVLVGVPARAVGVEEGAAERDDVVAARVPLAARAEAGVEVGEAAVRVAGLKLV